MQLKSPFRYFTWVCAFGLLVCTSVSHAWSGKIHYWLTNDTYAELTQEQQKYYFELYELLSVSSKSVQTKTSQSKTSQSKTSQSKTSQSKTSQSKTSQIKTSQSRTSQFKNSAVDKNIEYKFGNLGRWADKIRKKEIADLFTYIGAETPEGLNSIANKNTNRWHYHNLAYVDGAQREKKCGLKTGEQNKAFNQGQLLYALELIDLELKKASTSKAQEAILIAFLVHLIQDLHQPLHSVSHVHSNCEHDRGGNFFCVKYKNGKCRLNLHRLWDGGFGVEASELLSVKDKSLFDGVSEKQDLEFSPDLWIQESVEYAPLIYNVARHSKYKASEGVPYSSTQYQNLGKRVTTKQLSKAKYRTLKYLEAHFKLKNK